MKTFMKAEKFMYEDLTFQLIAPQVLTQGCGHTGMKTEISYPKKLGMTHIW